MEPESRMVQVKSSPRAKSETVSPVPMSRGIRLSPISSASSPVSSVSPLPSWPHWLPPAVRQWSARRQVVLHFSSAKTQHIITHESTSCEDPLMNGCHTLKKGRVHEMSPDSAGNPSIFPANLIDQARLFSSRLKGVETFFDR